MVFSVYNYATRQYDYYRGGKPTGTHAGSPPISWGRHALGATPEQASWRVPAGAVKIGSGELPQGRIATQRAMGLGDVELGGTSTWLLLGALGFLAWKVLR